MKLLSFRTVDIEFFQSLYTLQMFYSGSSLQAAIIILWLLLRAFTFAILLTTPALFIFIFIF